MDTEHTKDKLALFCLAGLVVMVLGGIVLGVFWRVSVPDKGDVLLGGISTGLILFLRDLVNAVRTSWEEVTRGKTTDALIAAPSPADKREKAPEDAQTAAQDTADAAQGRADEIKDDAGG